MAPSAQHTADGRALARPRPPRLKQLPPAKIPIPSTRRTKAYPRAPAEALARAAAVGRWEGLYDDVRRRRAAGQSLRRINRETGLARATVRKYAFDERFRRHGRRGPGRSHLDPHLDHLHARYAEGCENAMELWRELRAFGFPGTVKQIRRWLSERRTRPARTTAARYRTQPSTPMIALGSPPPLPSPKQLSWHLLREPKDLDTDAAAVVARVLKDEVAARVVDLARRFCRIVAVAAAARRPRTVPSPPSMHGWATPARAVSAWSKASPPASARMGLRSVPA